MRAMFPIKTRRFMASRSSTESSSSGADDTDVGAVVFVGWEKASDASVVVVGSPVSFVVSAMFVCSEFYNHLHEDRQQHEQEGES